MFLRYDFSRLPMVVNLYRVRRRTVWQIVDPDLLMIFVTEGSCRITLDHEDYLLTEGSLFLVPPGREYLRRPVDNGMCTMYYAHLRLRGGISGGGQTLEDADAIACMEEQLRQSEAIPGEMPEAPAGNGNRSYADAQESFCLPILTDCSSEREDFSARFAEALAVYRKRRPDSGVRIATLLMPLLLTAAGKALDAVPVREEPWVGSLPGTRKLQGVMTYIRAHAKETVTLDDLCAVCNFSRQHLIRLFRAELGMTPKAYIAHYRINCAKELLFRFPSMTVGEAASAMGFEDPHYFSRLFVRVTGQTPSAYRLHIRNFDEKKQ